MSFPALTTRRNSLLAATLTGVSVVGVLAGSVATAGDSSLGDPDGPVAVTMQPPAAAVAAASAARKASGGRITAVPRPSIALPSKVDIEPTYVGQDSCDPNAKPGAKAYAKLMMNTFGQGSAGIVRLCDLGDTSEHKEGRAIDWMLSVNIPSQKAAGDAATAWLTANGGINARRLGVSYIIWNRRMWRSYAPERGWTVYTGSNPHTDHVHTSLTWDGAMMRTSWWTGRAVTANDLGPCRVYAGQYAPLYTKGQYRTCSSNLPAAPSSPYAVATVGMKSTSIAKAQAKLGLSADGSFGSGTWVAVKGYQKRVGLPVTGALDKATWARLLPTSSKTSTTTTATTTTYTSNTSGATQTLKLPSTLATRLTPFKTVGLKVGSTGAAVKALQKALGQSVTGTFTAKNAAAVKAVQKRFGLPQTGRVDLRTWNRVELTAFPWLGYVKNTYKVGSTGAGVKAVQKALGVTADGSFGTATANAVKVIQKRYGIQPSGVIGPLTWKAIAAAKAN